MTYQQFPIIGPFQGHVDNVPSPHNPPNSFDEIRNFICRKGRFHTRPKLVTFGAPPDGAIVRYMRTFQDVQNFFHSLVLTTKTAYFLTSGAVYNALTLPGGLADLTGTALPYGCVVSNNRIYFSNGSCAVLYVDGESSVKDSTCPGASRFMTINASHLIIGYTTEPEPGVVGSRDYKQRVRWSKSGDFNDWTSFTSGTEDLLDVPDNIAGLATLGRNTVVLRDNGLTLMTPTGLGGSPFTFSNMSWAPVGVGNAYPYSLGIFGDTAAFVSKNDIYTVNGGLQLTPIGGKAKKKIFSQIAQASGDVVTGTVISQIAPGIDYLSYWLTIPGVNITWVYNYDEDNWQEFSSTSGRVTFVGELATA